MLGDARAVQAAKEWLLQMPPVAAADDIPDLRGANPEPFSDSYLPHPCGVGFADGNYVNLGDSCLAMLLAMHAAWSPSALVQHVIHVVSVCAQEEVAGANTGRIVAMMENQKALRNGPEVKFPRESRCRNPSRVASAVMKLRVTLKVCTTKPPPATVRSFDFSPESLFNRCPLRVENSQGVAVSQPSRVVHLAPATHEGRLETMGNATLRLHRKGTPFGVTQPEVIRLAAAFILPHGRLPVRGDE